MIKMVGTKMKDYGKEKNAKYAKMNQVEADKLLLEAKKHERMQNKMNAIYKSFYVMAHDAGKMDELFSDFVDTMKVQNGKGMKMMPGKGKRVNLIMLQSNVRSIIRSFQTSMTTTNHILMTIDNAQDRFNAY